MQFFQTTRSGFVLRRKPQNIRFVGNEERAERCRVRRQQRVIAKGLTVD